MKHLKISMEDISDGNSRKEIELEYYARVENLDEIINLSQGWEDQEQWGIPSKNKDTMLGSVRCRKTINKDGAVTYVQTIKTKEQTGRNEASLPVTNDIFQMFKTICPDGLVKRRYFIPVENEQGVKFKFEIDTSSNKLNGEVWVKIDLEIQDNLNQDIPKIPFKYIEMIEGNSQLEDERQKIANIYREVFRIYNPSLR